MQKKCLLIVLFGLSASIFLSSCADDQARAQIADTNARLAKLQGNVGVIDNKVSDQKMIDVLNKLDSLQSQIDELNGKVATVSNDQKTYQATQDQLYQSIEQQIQSLGGQPISQKAIPPKVAASAIVVKRSASSTNKAASQTSGGDLKSALKKIKSRNFPQAIKELKNIINTSQDASTVQNATYYLTVTYAANSQYKDAIVTGRKFASDYPDSQNVPDALRTVYISQKQLGMKQSAAKTAALIQQKYPDSDAAKKIGADAQSPAPND
jgi:TolA-binding protein